eukprot:scaffold13917_cov52-Phaeocystis_antarctica.AAC.1
MPAIAVVADPRVNLGCLHRLAHEACHPVLQVVDRRLRRRRGRERERKRRRLSEGLSAPRTALPSLRRGAWI